VSKSFPSFEEFWRFYVSQHAKAATRWLHVVGTCGGLAILVGAAIVRRPAAAAAAPAFAYGLAWFSHFAIEKNRPATFAHPGWSLRADFRMLRLMLSFRMSGEAERILAVAASRD
jgi:hypothetical protein